MNEKPQTSPEKPVCPPQQELAYRPSALPMLDLCPKFLGASSEYTAAGNKRHNHLAQYFQGNKEAFKDLPENFREDLEWAAEYVELKAPVNDYPLKVEERMEATLENGLPIQGTCDLTCGPELFDLKSRPRDYRAQMAAYAYMHLDKTGLPECRTHLLYASMHSIRIHTWTKESAWEYIRGIITNVESAWAAPTPCEYCGWCAKRLKCEALIQQVNIALAANPEWNLPQWHSSEMSTAKELGLALKIARSLGDWCESVEFHAKEKATKEGIIPEGFALTTRQGNRYVDDIEAAFTRCNLPQEEFIKSCSIKMKILFETYASFHGLKKAVAEREIEKRMGDLILRKAPSAMLVAEKTPKTKN